MILRILAVTPRIQKVDHSLYLREVLGLRLGAAKQVTNDVLDGKPRDVEVPEGEGERHVEALRRLGAVVELVQAEQAA